MKAVMGENAPSALLMRTGMNLLKVTSRTSAPLVLASALWMAPLLSTRMWAQAVAAPPATGRQMGTVKAVAGTTLTLATDAGRSVSVTVGEGARIVQVAPGSTDLKAAQTITLTDIGAGDKVLVTGKPGESADSLTATRIILMKSGDLAQKRIAEQADWQRRGVGGIVGANDGTGTLILSSGTKKMEVHTTPATIFRRYAGDSVRFEDAKPGTLAQIQAGDQFEVRGTKSGDGLSMVADEVVSGSFRNLSGTLASVDAAAGTVTLKDLTTKKSVTVTLTGNSDVRRLPPELGARFAARERGSVTVASGTKAPEGSPSVPASSPTGARADARGQGGSSGPGVARASSESQSRSVGMDLSRMLARLPSSTLADLKAGDAVMIVASQTQTQTQPRSETLTAVTLLAGVEAILSAAPSGSQAMTLSPWNVGGGAPEGGGGAP